MDLKLPPLGEGADSGTIVSIYVKEGDTVTKGQSIIELETGKAVAPIPASAAGTVTKLLVAVGDKLAVGQSILSLGGAAGAEPAKPAAKPAAAKPAARPAPAAEAASMDEPAGDIPDEAELPADVTPAAPPSIRRVARELGIDLRKVRGSEAGGRIAMADLRAYIQHLQRLAAQPRAVAAPAAAAPVKPVPPPVDFTKWGPVLIRPMSQLRKVISERLGQSWNAVPRVTQFEEADITALDALRQKHAAAFEKKGVRLTLTSFALKIVADALKKYPIFNTSIDEAASAIVFKEYVNLGLAVDTDQGLIVPVIRNADKKDLLQLSKELGELAVKARDRKLSLEELQGGTFTISNQGGIGGGQFTPIINLPEVAILGLGRGAIKPVVRDGKIETRLMMPLAVSYDHRVIDGGAAVRFALDLVQGFEKFNEGSLKTAAGS